MSSLKPWRNIIIQAINQANDFKAYTNAFCLDLNTNVPEFGFFSVLITISTREKPLRDDFWALFIFRTWL